MTDLLIDAPPYPIVSWSQTNNTNVVPPSGSLAAFGYVSGSAPAPQALNYYSKLGLTYSTSISASLEALQPVIQEIEKHKNFVVQEHEDHYFNSEKAPQRFRGHCLGTVRYFDRSPGGHSQGAVFSTDPNKGSTEYTGICTAQKPVLFGYPRDVLVTRNIRRETYDDAWRTGRTGSGFIGDPGAQSNPNGGFLVYLQFPIDPVDYGVIVQMEDVVNAGFFSGPSTNVNVGSFYPSKLYPHVYKQPSFFVVRFQTVGGSRIAIENQRNIAFSCQVWPREIRQVRTVGADTRHPEVW